jgi:hypothetical protein
MKNKNYILSFSNHDIPLQVLTMKDSYYIYIGNSNMSFDNLVMSIPTLGYVASSDLIDDIPNSYSKIISQSLTQKLNKPIFLSMNINDVTLLVNPMLVPFLEEKILSVLN